MTFRDFDLNKHMVEALEEANLVHPTSIQKKTFSKIMSGRDILGIAQTGTGKTLAYVLPLLKLWRFQTNRHTQILVLVPTRELVVQVVEEFEKVGKYMSVTVKGVYGGVNLKTQAFELADGCDILVGTPGRVLDLGFHGSLQLKSIKKLVIDEVDEMLALGFRSQLQQIFDLLPDKKQNLLFSATMTEDVEKILEEYFHDPEHVEAAPAGTPVEKVTQLMYRIPNFYSKLSLLQTLLTQNNSMNKVLVFVSTKAMADILLNKLDETLRENTGIIHSNKDQNFRFRAVNAFKSGESRILIATDIIARGIDVEDVSHVINFDVPSIPESYIHRIGRTGRADKFGDAITFVSDFELEQWSSIEAFLERTFLPEPLPEGVTLSDELIPEEMPVIKMKNVLGKIPQTPSSGGAFHDKKDKNKKTNSKIRYKDKMHAKYGKPKTRGQKPRGKK